MGRTLARAAAPRCRLVELERLRYAGLIVRIELAVRPNDLYWMLLRRPQAELCSNQPGDIEDLVLRTGPVEHVVHM